VEYSRPLDAASITSASVQLIGAAGGEGMPVSAAVRSGRTIRVVPNTALKPSAVYQLRLSGAVADAQGSRVLPASQLVMTGTADVSGQPMLVETVPPGDTREIDAFGAIHLIFDRPLNPLTVSAGTIRVTQGDKLVAVSVEFGKDGAELILTPLAPWTGPGSVQVSVAGVEDLAGNGLASWSGAFTVRAAQRRAGGLWLPGVGRPAAGQGALAAR